MASIYRVGQNWRAQVRLAGQPSRSQVFPSKAEAIRWARGEEAKKFTDVEDGGRPYTVAMAFEAYASTLAETKKTKAQNLRNMKAHFGHYRLAELKTKHIVEFAKQRLSGELTFIPKAVQPSAQATRRKGVAAGPSTVMMNLTYLKVALKYAAMVMGSRDGFEALRQCDNAIAALRHGRLVSDSEESGIDGRRSRSCWRWRSILILANDCRSR
jgi:hypothetical protein